MFDFSMSEIALIGVVALVLIGPKDLPIAVKAVTGMIKKARRMASEFQTHVDDMVKDADLGDLKESLNEIRNFDMNALVEKHVDGDGSLRNAFGDTMNQTPGSYSGLETVPTENVIVIPPQPEPIAILAADDPLAFLPPRIAAPPMPPPFLPPTTTLPSR